MAIIMSSLALPDYLKELGHKLSTRIPEIASGSKSNRDWTRAVYCALKQVAEEHSQALADVSRWKIYPEDRCYAGEYLCDFMLFEDGYGCRLTCESQWLNWRNEDRGSLEWAFDKLRGVKSDIKLFIFE